MIYKFKTAILLCITSFSISASNSQLADKISDEVVDALIESHAKMINTNILSEICRSPQYLSINYAANKIRSEIAEKIKIVATQRKLEQYNLTELIEITSLEFQAFLDGTRYGAYVAKNYKLGTLENECSKEVQLTLQASQKKLSDEESYLVVSR
ncbi:hypothetical protein [Aliikangiella maris]|uniref:Uncharacterized protein n=2 Tax=Aliikangiella maris TaxID=3162458 RepID=A0ABV3MK92_9GAMM